MKPGCHTPIDWSNTPCSCPPSYPALCGLQILLTTPFMSPTILKSKSVRDEVQSQGSHIHAASLAVGTVKQSLGPMSWVPD